MNNKNTLVTLIIILTSLITFLGGYLIAQKNDRLPQTANISNLNRFSASKTSGQPKNEPKLSRISTVKAANPSLSEDGKKILYTKKETGKIFATDFSGQENSFIETESKNLLNKNISGVALSKNKQKIAYLYFNKNTGEGQISIANPDGSVFKNILPTRAEQLKLDWASQNQISFYNPKGEDHSLFLLDLDMGNRQLEKILDSLNDLKVLWSPDGLKLLYSYRDEEGSKIYLLDSETKTSYTIGLLTEADRCVWTLNSLFIYCGVPKDDSGDSLYQLDINKKDFGLVFEPSSVDKIRIKNSLLSPAENYLFFVNGFDGYLYKINL